VQILGIAVDRLGTASRLIVGAIALVTIGVIFYIVMSAGGAAYAPAFTNLDARSAGDLQAALSGAGIPSKLADGGATVEVPSSKVDQARVAAGKAGVGSTRADWSLLDKSSLSQTDGQWQMKVQRVRSDLLAAQIENIAGVCRATVNLAIPERSVFSADQDQPHASVNIDTCGGVLTDTAVRGIVALVAGAVPGLASTNVAVIDQEGHSLSSASSMIGVQTADAMAAESAWESRQSGIAQTALDRLVGVGNGSAIVAGQLNFDQTTEKTQTFGGQKGAIQNSTETEKLTQNGGSNGGITGTSANIPGAAVTTGAASSNYTHDKSAGTNAIDTTQTDTTKVGGTPVKMSVSVVVSKKALDSVIKGASTNPTTQAAATKIVQDTIANAVGYDAANTQNKIAVSAVDALPNAIQSLKAAGVPVVGGAGAGGGSTALGGLIPAPFGGYVQPLMAGIGLLVLLLLTRKSLARRQALLGETDASWLPALEAPPIKIDELMPAYGGPSAGEVQAAEKKALQNRVEEIAQTRPSDVAAQLRGWLATDA
jgi:flagellar M-ring protein FliF